MNISHAVNLHKPLKAGFVLRARIKLPLYPSPRHKTTDNI